MTTFAKLSKNAGKIDRKTGKRINSRFGRVLCQACGMLGKNIQAMHDVSGRQFCNEHYEQIRTIKQATKR